MSENLSHGYQPWEGLRLRDGGEVSPDLSGDTPRVTGLREALAVSAQDLAPVAVRVRVQSPSLLAMVCQTLGVIAGVGPRRGQTPARPRIGKAEPRVQIGLLEGGAE